MSNLSKQPAFPRPGYDDDRATVSTDQPGMTYRQWLVGQALQGILSNPVYLNNDIIRLSRETAGNDWASKLAIIFADQTIACLEEGL